MNIEFCPEKPRRYVSILIYRRMESGLLLRCFARMKVVIALFFRALSLARVACSEQAHTLWRLKNRLCVPFPFKSKVIKYFWP